MKKRLLLVFTILLAATLLFAACGKKKGDQAAPALTVAHKTDTVIILGGVNGAEYSKDDGATWQAASYFTGLTPDTAYRVTARMKETDAKKASPAATAQTVTTSTLLGSLTVKEKPKAVISAGRDISFTGGKLAYTLTYGGREFTSEVDIEPEWLEVNANDKSFKVNYGGKTINGSFDGTLGLGADKAKTVTNAEQLTAALRSESVELIYVEAGVYELTASGTTTYVESAKTIIGNGATVKISGQVSSQASIIFKENVTIKNLNFVNLAEKAPVKFSKITAPLEKINKIYLENVSVTGKSGVNLHGVKNAELVRVTVNPDADSYGVALAVREAAVNLRKCTIGKAAWGSAGIMYGAGDDLSSRLVADGETDFSGAVYVENYAAYAEEDINPVSGLSDRTFEVNERGQGVYTLPQT